MKVGDSRHCTETELDNLVLSKSQVMGAAGEEGDKGVEEQGDRCTGKEGHKLMTGGLPHQC